MNFTSQICTTEEQSERLIALGLRKETADCFHWNAYGRSYIGNIDDEKLGPDDVPAWSLHRLIEIYSKDSITPRIKLDEINFEWLVDAIAFRIQERDLYKEYLKEK